MLPVGPDASVRSVARITLPSGPRGEMPFTATRPRRRRGTATGRRSLTYFRPSLIRLLLESQDIRSKTLPARHSVVLFDTQVFALGVCAQAPDRLISGTSEVASAGFPVRATSRLGDPQE